MSHPPQQKLNTDKGVKQRATTVKEPTEHAGDVFYSMGPPAHDSTHMDSGSSTAVFNPEKGPQGRVHYQSTAKWTHQDPTQVPGWSQEAPVQTWGQNVGSYMGGMNNIRTQMAFPKGGHDGGALQIGGEKQAPGSLEVYREAAQAQERGRDWEHANSAVHQAHLQAFQQGHKGVDIQAQPHIPGSMLQPFQLAFGPTKQHLPSAYYQVYQGNKGMPNRSYSDPPKTQHQMLQLQQQIQQHQIQQQQQQQLQQQHLHQHQQHQQLQHQIQQQQMQKQQLQQMQQYCQQQMQEQRQQVHQFQQQQQPHNLPQQDALQPHFQQKQHQNQHFMSYQSPGSCLSSTSLPPQNDNAHFLDTQGQAIEVENQFSDSSVTSDSVPQKVSPLSAEPFDAPQVLPRRSRRLSRDGQSPLGGPPTMAPWTQASRELQAPQNGQVAGGVEEVNAGEKQAAPGGVIQSTRRRRRASKEINLETLAQKASEMEFLPAKVAKQEDGAHGRQPGMVPLVIPVSVPVGQNDPLVSWHHGCTTQQDQFPPKPEHKPSVIVARRRSLRNSLSDSCVQDAESDTGKDDDGKFSKSKRRPRPEPLFIPPPKPVTFIAPSVYSSITAYQSHLRSPIRMLEHPLVLPPYTPPPILSPVRDGSGLYFSTFLSSIAAGNQSLPPPLPPKSTSRSLLRSCSSDITPPVLPLITDPTPVSFEPRINIGLQYQAEVPELCERCLPQMDQPKADLVWVPIEKLHSEHVEQHRVDDMLNLACSSVFYGGGTNQELALHCLHVCGGDVLEALALLFFKVPVFSEGHHLADYHYSGSDSWTPAEKRYFNKGISAYRKDFFMVQKLVQTKSVAQCVEFYYTYKKQVKIGRNGSLTYGPSESPIEKITEATVDVKNSQHPMLIHQEGESRKWEGSCEQSQDGTVVSDTLQTHENTGLMLMLKESGVVNKVSSQSTPPCKPQPESAGKKRRAPPKTPQEPEGVFPCKKCTRVFYKVKSRSAHMKSHAEQEKKAAALRLKEEEEARVRVVAEEARMREATLREAAEEGQTSSRVKEADKPEASSREESSEAEDEDDEDWH